MPSNISHLLIRYNGNKFREYKDFKDYINFNNIKNIIEPFCGTASISFNIWMEYGDKFNYYINDKDIDILDHFKYIKNNNIDDIINNLNIQKKQYNTKEKFKELYNEWCIDKDPFKRIIIGKLSLYTLSSFRNRKIEINNAYNSSSKLNKYQRLFKQFLNSNNVFISNDDWKDCYNKFKNDNQSIILFDPPYIDTSNTFYKEDCRCLNIYNNLDEIKKNNSKSYFIIQKTDKNDELFKDWNQLIIYNKIYNIGNKKIKHIVYSN